jgi:MraZ protein
LTLRDGVGRSGPLWVKEAQKCTSAKGRMSDSASNAKIIYYNSLYRHGVDDKRRLQIPSKWRPAEEGVELTLLLWPKASMPDACILVLPPEEWMALVQKLKALPFADPKAETLRSIIGQKSDRVTLDKGGRICLPETMAKAAEIEREAVLLGLVDRFQIWNPERFQLANNIDEQLSNEAFRQI